MRLALAVFIGVFACGTAMATVYQWVDNQGVVHMTDSADNVPAAYRKGMKALEIDTGGATAPARVLQDQPAAGTPSLAEKEAPYDGHDEGWWRNRFVRLRTDIRNLQDRIETSKKTLVELHRKRVLFQKPSDRVAYSALSDEIAKDEEILKGLEKNLDDLTFQADGAGVPLEWRE